MNVRAVPRTAVESYLRLVRLPLDGAISLLPGKGTGAKPAARLALDRADAAVRAVIATILGDPVIREDAQPRGTAERDHALPPRDDARTADTDVRARDEQVTQQRERAREDANGRRQAAAHKKEKEQRHAAKVERERLSASRRTAQDAEEVLLGGRAPAERVKTVSANLDGPHQKAEGLTGRDASDGPETSRARLEAAPSAPSHKDIADRAYELYRRGVPGNADAHWLAAEREVTLVPD
jgi:Protein of unknown function (DUF2934)